METSKKVLGKSARDALAKTDARRDVVPTTYQLHPSSLGDPNFKKLRQSLTQWVNSYVIRDQMTVRDISADLADGYILAAFLERITNERIVEPQLLATSSERSKQLIVSSIVSYIEKNLKIQQDAQRWTMDGILANDISSVVCLLVDLAHVIGCPYALPSNVSIAIIKREELPDGVKNKTTVHKVTADETKYMIQATAAMRVNEGGSLDVALEATDLTKYEPDAFDKLFDSTERMKEVTRLLLEFVNTHLEGLNIRINNLTKLESAFLVLLIGSLGDFFVPVYFYDLTPGSTAAKLENVRFAISMMAELGIDVKRINASGKTKTHPPLADIVRKDVKSISRCIYYLFQTFKSPASQVAA
ncbi:hypothetical protein HK104_004538 [Borealophlyctis nickersoniae]|nr:hypothetical protein HK104_004538 [Borealophlyctis nickersoniae]